MARNPDITIAGIGVAVAGAAGLAAAIGVVARGDGAVETVTSVRAETYQMATSGVYAFNAQRVVAEGIGWDLFTLLVAVPATLLAAWFVARGSVRARFVVAGLLGYFLYQYLEYAVTWAFGPLFLLFIAIYALSLVGIGVIALDIGRASGLATFGPGFPRRAWPALLVTMSVLLTVMWIGRVVQGLTDGVDGLLLGETTMTVQALDLGLLVPISLAVAVLVWRRHPLGDMVSAAYSVTFAALTAAIGSMLLSASAINGVLEVVPLAIFGSAAAVGLWLGVRIHRSLQPTETHGVIAGLPATTTA